MSTAAPQKWLLMRHEAYQSLVAASPEANEPAKVAEPPPDRAEPTLQPAAEIQRAPPNRPASRSLRALQMMLANNESIAWPQDQLTLYGHGTGRSAAKLLSELNKRSMRVDVAQKIVLHILSKTAWKRAD